VRFARAARLQLPGIHVEAAVLPMMALK